MVRIECVCYDHTFRTCNALEPKHFIKDGCKNCAFYKDLDTYMKQTGKTYEAAMRWLLVYGQNRNKK